MGIVYGTYLLYICSGFILNMMGIDQAEVRPIIKRHMQGFLTDMSPLVSKVIKIFAKLISMAIDS